MIKITNKKDINFSLTEIVQLEDKLKDLLGDAVFYKNSISNEDLDIVNAGALQIVEKQMLDKAQDILSAIQGAILKKE